MNKKENLEKMKSTIKKTNTLVLFQFLDIIRDEIKCDKNVEKMIILELEKRYPNISKEL